jgi:hypothetical protein
MCAQKLERLELSRRILIEIREAAASIEIWKPWSRADGIIGAMVDIWAQRCEDKDGEIIAHPEQILKLTFLKPSTVYDVFNNLKRKEFVTSHDNFLAATELLVKPSLNGIEILKADISHRKKILDLIKDEIKLNFPSERTRLEVLNESLKKIDSNLFRSTSV